MAASKRVSSKQKLEDLMSRMGDVVDVQAQHNEKIGQLVESFTTLNSKMDQMITLLQKAGEVEVGKKAITEQKTKKEITFAEL